MSFRREILEFLDFLVYFIRIENKRIDNHKIINILMNVLLSQSCNTSILSNNTFAVSTSIWCSTKAEVGIAIPEALTIILTWILPAIRI